MKTFIENFTCWHVKEIRGGPVPRRRRSFFSKKIASFSDNLSRLWLKIMYLQLCAACDACIPYSDTMTLERIKDAVVNENYSHRSTDRISRLISIDQHSQLIWLFFSSSFAYYKLVQFLLMSRSVCQKQTVTENLYSQNITRSCPLSIISNNKIGFPESKFEF